MSCGFVVLQPLVPDGTALSQPRPQPSDKIG